MERVGRMNNIKDRAEEIVMSETKNFPISASPSLYKVSLDIYQ